MLELILLITTTLSIHTLAWLTPGPLSVLIIRNSLVYSRKIGVWTAVGIGIGNFIHITYSIVGLTYLIETSDIIFNVIKYLGVGYLSYLGIKTFLAKVKIKNIESETESEDISPLKAIKIGFLTNILSPKASLFFASIFASIMSSNTPFWVVLFLWIAMPINSFIMATILSLFFTTKSIRSFYAKYQVIANKFLGGVLILLAVLIVFS